MRTHKSPQYLCEVLECRYKGSHTHFELAEHVRRAHPHIAAHLVKGQPIPWSISKPWTLELTSTSPNISVTPFTLAKGIKTTSSAAKPPASALTPKSINIAVTPITLTKGIKSIPAATAGPAVSETSPPNLLAASSNEESFAGDDEDTEEEVKLAEEATMLAGFTEDVKEYVRQFNIYTQKIYPAMRIHTPESRSAISENFVAGLRLCSGMKDQKCPYGVAITPETSCLVPQQRTAKDRKSMESVLIMRSRCLMCTRASNMTAMLQRLQKEQDGVLICSQTANCTFPRLPGRLQCHKCADAWNVKALEREMSGRIQRNIKFGAGSQVRDAASMKKCLDMLQNIPSLGNEWLQLFSRAQTAPRTIFIVDTETGMMGLQDVHEVGIVTYDGVQVVNELIDHGCTVAKYFERTLQEVESRRMMSYNAVQKSYGPPSSNAMNGLKYRALLLKLEQAGMSKSSFWVEHSLGQFDYRHVQSITPPDLRHILPDPDNVFSTLTLWRKILPGLFGHKLSHIHELLSPGDPLTMHRHAAYADALMCRELLKTCVEKFGGV